METLDDMRKSIDNIDNAIIAMLAERFKVTERVGYYKAKANLPSKDTKREAHQYEKITTLAEHYGLDADVAKNYLHHVIEKVVANHENIAKSINDEK